LSHWSQLLKVSIRQLFPSYGYLVSFRTLSWFCSYSFIFLTKCFATVITKACFKILICRTISDASFHCHWSYHHWDGELQQVERPWYNLKGCLCKLNKHTLQQIMIDVENLLLLKMHATLQSQEDT
jgi:hypothetical protein